ncbi:Krueppel-like factor-like protein [Emericellopsis cladophorae]|uniref:Krueppel-like factor-like protein n=1 Tax=Emericellopsis cladophorae TaxID=2686198 RepID=A0A9Q0BFF5_9HYPO|nr:Krueppel-like factor-like protein [Emericellopsis cladophorae]KAI6782841.1 Krueppel-like factor-like protein [Emericellopsis cladophorae]
MPTVYEQAARQDYYADATLLSRNSPSTPPMQPVAVNLKPSQSPPPQVSSVPIVIPPDPDDGQEQRRSLGPESQTLTGDRTLLYLMGAGRNLYSSGLDSTRPLPGCDRSNYGSNHRNHQLTPRSEVRSNGQEDKSLGRRESRSDDGGRSPARALGGPHLQVLASGALEAVDRRKYSDREQAATSPSSPLDISMSTRQLSIQDPHSPSAPRPIPRIATHEDSPNGLLSPPNGGLPSIASFGPDPAGQSLPSLRSTLGPLPPFFHPDLSPRSALSPVYPHSPPYLSPNQLPPMSNRHCSPPISPPDSHKRGLPSPSSLQPSSPYHTLSQGSSHRPSVDYTNGAVVGDIPNPDHRVPAEAPAPGVNRMSIEGITNQGQFRCSVRGCTAQPFSTQYLLNSHANVHSSARPHYCPVPGCPRGEAGMGFKRKNEMIRHGLVHDSPGYVCPFCPDKDRKYPRPDNLQRHVRSRHVDKDKNDPQLRDVLEQRLEGPHRGRRRRVGS